MKALDKLILHVVHNMFPLNEYSEGEINRLMNQFKEEADDLNITVTDNQLKNYIERFDQLKNSPKIAEKDLRKYTLSKLIKLVSSSKGDEAPEAIDDTPDVVYNQNGIIIYNGSKEENCLTFGRGESWCITKGSFGNYRYDDSRKNPTFYLVKDTNLPNSDRKSFFVVVVGSDNTYKVSDRSNNDVGGRGTEWDRWEQWPFVEQQFPSVRGLRSYFKYIPLSNSEKLNQHYKNIAIDIRQWMKFPFSGKEQYLVVRKGNVLFSDITNQEFIEKYLPKYPQIATLIATNYGIINTETLLINLDKFNNQDTRSIIANMRDDKLDLKWLKSEKVSFEVKKFITKFDKWKLLAGDKIYVSKDGNNIVKLNLNSEGIKMSLYTEDDDFPDVNLNKRTVKYILEYPEIDKIPFSIILGLGEKSLIDKPTINRFIEKAKEDPDSSIKVKDIEDGQILIDSNALTAYKIQGEEIKKIAFNDPEVQRLFASEMNSNEIQENTINIFKQQTALPGYLDKESLLIMVRAIPFSNRTWQIDGRMQVLLTSNEAPHFFVVPVATNDVKLRTPLCYGSEDNWRQWMGTEDMTENMWNSYFIYLRSQNRTFTDNTIISLLNSSKNYNPRVNFVKSDPPVSNENTYVPKYYGGIAYLINKRDSRSSLQVSRARSTLIKANLPYGTAAQMLGGGTAIANVPAATIPNPNNPNAPRGRGRPPGRGGVPQGAGIPIPGRPRPQAMAAGDGAHIGVNRLMDQYGLTDGFDELNRGIRNRLRSVEGVEASIINNRGASRRENLLGNAGRVVAAVNFGTSVVYIIRLNRNANYVASIVIQPGNGHFIVSSDSAEALNSPSDLMTALQSNNLAEIKGYLTNDYLGRNPHHLDEFKTMLRKHIEETKKS